MRFRTFRRTSFSTADGGGDPGRAAGIVPAITTGAGRTILILQCFTDMFPRGGETIIKNTVGREILGNTDVFRIRICSATGINGNATDIGKGKDGVCKSTAKIAIKETEEHPIDRAPDRNRNQDHLDNYFLR